MKNTIGISMGNDPPASFLQIETPNKHCHFIGQARNGKSFCIQSKDINCPLARYYLGLDKGNIIDLCKTLVSWGDAINEDVAFKYLESVIPIGQPVKHIIYFPYPQKNIEPHIIIKIGTPDGIMPLVQKFSSVTGQRINASLSGIGAACGECTVYPLITGKENISLGCYGSRPGVNLKKDELFLAFPCSSKMTEIISRSEHSLK